MDRAAFASQLIGMLRETAPPVSPVKTGKDSLHKKLSANALQMTEETIYEGKEREQTYPLAVNITYHRGDHGKSRFKRTGYAAYGLEDRTPQQAVQIYSHRSRIEKNHEKFREARALMAPSTTIRLFYGGVGFISERMTRSFQSSSSTAMPRGLNQ